VLSKILDKFWYIAWHPLEYYFFSLECITPEGEWIWVRLDARYHVRWKASHGWVILNHDFLIDVEHVNA
jgi:hypothetical protein